MTKVLRWIALTWTVLAIPYVDTTDFSTIFFGLVYLALIIGILIEGIRKDK